MILWSFQHQKAWDSLCSEGILRAEERFCPPDFARGYDWMSRQLSKRVCPPPPGVKHPIWAWYRWEGARKAPKPRRNQENCVLLTVDVPDESVLLSDFDRWHVVLNGQYLAVNEADDERFCGDTEDLRRSWERIFDLTPSDYGGGCDFVQAVFWEIRKEWVIAHERV